MEAAEVHERWEGDRYEAWALVGGLKFSCVFWRDPIRGWTHNFRNTAFDAVQALAATTPKATESQK